MMVCQTIFRSDMSCPKCDENQGRGECDDHPLFTMEQLSDFVWGLLRAVGIIFSLMAVLWFLGKVHS